MILGIFARTFKRPSLEGVLDAVQAHGLRAVQFNTASAGLPSMPDEIEPGLLVRIRAALEARGLEMAAVSGTFNMIHPDPRRREEGLRRLGVLAAACRPMGTSTITLCTGTRDPDDKWRWHPGNALPDAWRALRGAMERALATADEHAVYLATEPDRANAVASPVAARRPGPMLEQGPSNKGLAPSRGRDEAAEAVAVLLGHRGCGGAGALGFPRFLLEL